MIRNFVRNWVGVAVDPQRLLALRHLPRYAADLVRFRKAGGVAAFRDSFPQLADVSATTPFDPHYFHQGAWIARRLAASKPAQHVDVGSSVLTMSVLSAHVPTVFVDYRPLAVRHAGLSCIAGDISHLPFADGAIASLSCLHVIEHVGLGRYGDPIDPGGARKAAQELQRVVAPGGRLYLSTPIGRERVCFNAHRVSAVATVRAWFDALTLARFSFVGDDRQLHDDVSPDSVPALNYGCGFFEFHK